MGEEFKPYDLKELGKALKAKGLTAVENCAKEVVEEVMAWLEASAKASKNPYDDMALVIFPKVKELILAQVDKIDGQVG